jgi:pilus assembly protein CpaE
MEFLGRLRSFVEPGADRRKADARNVGLVDGAISAGELSALVPLLPNVQFEAVGATWPERYSQNMDVLIVGLDAASATDVEEAIRRLNLRPSWLQFLVVLRNADVPTSRALTRAGAADVLPAPTSEAALTLSLERLLAHETTDRAQIRKSGQVVAVLKAGGGVGATSLAVQAAHILAERGGKSSRVCFADLDLQFGAAALYFDVGEALTVTDCIAVGEFLGETQFATALAAHKSGVRVLAGPRELTALDTMTPQLAEALVSGLRRDFALTIIDMPSVWTAWTNRVLQLADRIVMVTQLSVAHVHLVRRQLGVISLQQLDALPLTLVCNAITSEQSKLLQIKAAERAIGRSFNIKIPSDELAMGAATNQGLTLSTVRGGKKLEKSVRLFANAMAAEALAPVVDMR